MANGSVTPPPALAYYDFYKTNSAPRSSFLVMSGGASLTRQEFAEEADINFIMKKYEYTGIPPSSVAPTYVDFEGVPQTLLEFMDLMQDADKAFMQLPAKVRREFDNDPIQFVDYASDPANVEQMRSWGLAAPKPPEEPVGASPVPAGDAPSGGEKPPGGAPKPVHTPST